MPLSLQIVSREKSVMGEDANFDVGKEGATIGRSAKNDWILPDKNRYVSSRHATVDYQAGAYYLIDTSTNGVFINGSETPVGAGKPQRLFNGDKLAIGDYEITVEITDDDDMDSIEELISSVVMDTVAEEDSVDSPMMVEENALTGARSLNARLFDGDDLAFSDTVANADASNVVRIDPTASASAVHSQTVDPQPAANSADVSDDDDVDLSLQSLSLDEIADTAEPPPEPDVTPADESAPIDIGLQKPANEAPPVRARSIGELSSPAGGHKLHGEAGAQLEFLRGLGLSLAELGDPNLNELMHNAGQALREFIIGTMDLLQTRASLKNAFRLEQTTIQAGTNNPLKFSANVDDAIRNLLTNKSRQYAPTVETVRGVCKDIKVHEEALSHAARSAFDEFIERLEPEELSQRFDASLKRGAMFSSSRKAKYWDLYAELYEVITQRNNGQFPHTFSEDFVRAYEDYRKAANRRLGDD
ncbi:MAG: type VI secretion system-associated FHA domain protein TagH [Pseudomonadota bacterium]